MYIQRDEADKYLKKQGYTVAELQRRESEPATLAFIVDMQAVGTMNTTHKIIAPDRETAEMTIYDFVASVSPLITVANDATFTLLLCVYMLGMPPGTQTQDTSLGVLCELVS